MALLLTAASAQAASFVKNIGTNTDIVAGTSTAVTVPAAGVAAGNSIIVTASIDNGAGAVSCSDTQGNTYTVDLDEDIGTSHIIICAAHNVTPLVSGNTITLTHPSVAARAVSALEFSGISAGTPLDQTASASGAGTSPSSGATATTAQEKELIVGVIGTNTSSANSFTLGTWFRTGTRAGTTTGPPNQTVAPEYRFTSVTGGYAANATITSSDWSAGVATYRVDGHGMEVIDDVETGTLLKSANPPGKWTSQFTLAGTTLVASPTALRRGAYGILVSDSGTASSTNTHLKLVGPPVTGNYYLRFWFQQHTANEFTGTNVIGSIFDPTLPHLANIYISNNANKIAVEGKVNGGAWGPATTGMSLVTGTWYLIEVAVTNVGTASATRKLWVSGALQGSVTNLDWSAQGVGEIRMGNAYGADGSYLGDYYYDDIRGDSTPNASKFSIGIEAETHNIGQCNPVTISLLDSNSSPAGAPYAFDADVSVSGVTGQFYSDDVCASSTSTVSFAASATTAQTYFKASTAGTATLTASNIDFIDGSTMMSVSTPTALLVKSFTAQPAEGGAWLNWETDAEVQNIGFRIYREVNGSKELLTRELIFGSGLLVGAHTQMWGRSYSWLDEKPPVASKGVRYWLQSEDLRGVVTWHGPVSPKGKPSVGVVSARRATLDVAERVQRLESPPATALPQKRRAPIHEPTVESLSAQWRLLGAPALKIRVKEEGWYRIEASTLHESGLGTVPPQMLQLYVDGKEVPISVNASGDVAFFGMGLDSPYAAARTYWLAAGVSPGKRILTAASSSPPDSAGFSMQTLQYKERTLHFAALNNGEAENFFGPLLASGKPVALTFPLRGVSAAQKEAPLEVTLQGVTSTAHRVVATFNGHPLGELAFHGMGQGTFNASVPHSVLQEGDNTLTLSAEGGNLDRSLVVSATLAYPARISAETGAVSYLLPEATSADFSSVGAFSDAYDVTDFDEPTRLPVSGSALASTGQGPRLIQLVSPESSQAIGPLTLRLPTEWHALKDVDFVILSHSDFIPALKPLVQRRRAQGWRVAVVDVEEVYDEFSFGNHSPRAIRDFLRQVRMAGAPGLSHVLLVGDASLDSKNVLKGSPRDFLPTYPAWLGLLESASDGWLADFDEDGVPELAVGRFPVRTAAEAASLVQKTLDFEDAAAADKNWKRKALLVVGPGQGSEFQGSRAQLQAAAAPSLQMQAWDAASGKDLKQALAEGHFVVNYLGHGSTNTWQRVLSAAEVGASFPARPSLVLAATCLNGFFNDIHGDSLAELLLHKTQGGAAAVWASSALSYPEQQVPANAEFLRGLGQGSLSLGEMSVRARAATSDAVVRKSFMLFGDPTLFGAAPSAQAPSASGCGGCSSASAASYGWVLLALLGVPMRRRLRGPLTKAQGRSECRPPR